MGKGSKKSIEYVVHLCYSYVGLTCIAGLSQSLDTHYPEKGMSLREEVLNSGSAMGLGTGEAGPA